MTEVGSGRREAGRGLGARDGGTIERERSRRAPGAQTGVNELELDFELGPYELKRASGSP
jgi:hypothetical protein